ncbi:MAG: response regulator [Spirochaetia bacterium]|nr:response regulator [Spirochaetia bacterium]
MEKDQEYMLDLDYPLLDSIEFYIRQPDGWKKILTGDRRSFASRQSFHDSFAVPLKGTSVHSLIYIRIQTESSLFVPLYLYDRDSFENHKEGLNLFHGIYYGIAFSLFLYNLFIFLSMRNESYLYYILWIFSFASLQAFWNGHIFRYLLPESGEMMHPAGSLLMFVSLSFSVLFSMHFLNFKKYLPGFYKPVIFFAGILFFYAAVSIVIPYRFNVIFANVISMSGIILIMFAAGYVYLKGLKAARYFILAWLLMFGAVIFINFQSGVSVFSDSVMLYGYQTASAVEMLFLSFALSDNFKDLQFKITKIQEDLIENQKLTVEIIEASKERLERQIAVRTKDLEDAKDEAEKATELKDKFISLVSHDLKSPLLGILSLMDIFEEDPENKRIDAATKKRLTEQLKSSTRTLLDMIDQLLNIGRLKTGKIKITPEYFDLQEAADEAILLLSGIAAEKNINMLNHVPAGVMFFGDRMLIKEAVQNLLSNAVKFTNPEGFIEIYIPENEMNCFAVRDNGVGMDPKMIEKIISQRSITSVGTASERGSGLGLIFCMDIMDDHSGSIKIQSLQGEGSIFTIYLPKPENAVLIVDDNDAVRKSVRSFFAEKDCYILEAHDGIHALEIIQNLKPVLVVTDIHMPELGGFDLLKEIRNIPATADLPVIVMSSGPSSEQQGSGGLGEVLEELGADGFFLKPLDKELFLKKVDTLVHLKKKHEES